MTSKDKAGSRQVAIVTGSARRIGAAIVEALHRRGLDVIIHYRRSADEAERLAAALNTERANSARAVALDLVDPAAPGRLIERTLTAYGRIDVLVNNASTFYATPIERADAQAWDDLMISNLRAPFFLSRACAPHLARRRGAIVNLVDIHALVPLSGHPIYCQAKAGLVMQTRSLAKELAPAVRVNGVAPGAILWPASAAAEPEDILARVPLSHAGRPEDIAGAVAFLALDAPYITGQILAVDGGRTLNM